jgi:hypothetical protein
MAGPAIASLQHGPTNLQVFTTQGFTPIYPQAKVLALLTKVSIIMKILESLAAMPCLLLLDMSMMNIDHTIVHCFCDMVNVMLVVVHVLPCDGLL